MTKLQSIIVAIMATILSMEGMAGDGYIHKAALFSAGWMAGYLMLVVHMEWRGLDE